MSIEDDYTYLSSLHQFISQAFDKDELRTICFVLGLDYEELPGERKSAKVRELLLAVVKANRLAELLSIVKEQRPHIPWPPIPDDFQEDPLGSIQKIWLAPQPEKEARFRSGTRLILVAALLVGLLIVYQIIVTLNPTEDDRLEGSAPISSPTSTPKPTNTQPPTLEPTATVTATKLPEAGQGSESTTPTPSPSPTSTITPVTSTATPRIVIVPSATSRCTIVSVEILPEGADGRQAQFSWDPMPGAIYYRLYVEGNRADNPNAILKNYEVIDQTEYVIPHSGFVDTFFELGTDYRYTLQAFSAADELICEYDGTFTR